MSFRFPVAIAAVLCAVSGVSGVAGCTLQPTNPLDPDTPAAQQARAKVTGQVRAVFARDADGEPATPGACEESDVGDHSGFRIVLRGVRDGGAGVNALSAETNETGLFEFVGVPPGPYSLEILRLGFDLPPAAEVNVGAGEVRNLGGFCAINETGPAAPILAALPDLLRSADPAPSVFILDEPCDAATAGCAVRWRVSQEIEGEAAVVTDVTPLTVDAGVAVTTTRAANNDARFAVRVAVVAIDALGNESAASEDVVIVDNLAPLPPVLGTPTVGRDRLNVNFVPVVAADDDDDAVSFFVFYGVIVRADDDEGAADRDDCPFGRPRTDADGVIVDDNGRASFALEGASPLQTTTTTQTLSGIAPGTDVVVHVAAVDAAGNAGCYGPAQIARPDVVVLTPAILRGTNTANVARAAFIDGLTDGVVAVARGAGGFSVLNTANVVDADNTPTHDVDAFGRSFVTAVGTLGIRVIPVDGAGNVVDADVRTLDVAGADARSVALRPGTAIVGTRTGVAVVDLATGSTAGVVPVGSPVVDVASWGSLVIVATEDGLQLRQRDVLGVLVASIAQRDIKEVIVHDDAIVAALGARGLAVFNLRDCSVAEIGGGPGCLATVARRVLARDGQAVAVAAFDEFVVANVIEGEDADTGVLLTLDPRASLAIVGRAALSAPAGSVVVDDGLVCAAGGDSVVNCQSPLTGLADEERRLVTAGGVRRARAARGTAVAFEDADVAGIGGAVTRAPLATMNAVSRVLLPAGALGDDRIINPVGGVVLADGRVLAVDGVGNVVEVPPEAEGSARLVGSFAPDVLAALGDLNDENVGTVNGFVELLGSDLLLALTTTARKHAFVRVALDEDNNGVLRFAGVSVLALADADQNTNLVLRRGEAFVPTHPFGLTVVDVDGAALALGAGSVAPGAGGAADDVAFVAVDGASTSGFVLGTAASGAAGLFDVDSVGGDAVEIGAPAIADVANALVALQRFAVLSSRDLGVVTLLVDVPGGAQSFVPVLDLPSASQAEDTRATARGLLVSDSVGGVLRVTLR